MAQKLRIKIAQDRSPASPDAGGNLDRKAGLDRTAASELRLKQGHGEAETWLLAEDASTPLGFEVVCDALDLDAGYVRARLREWRRRAIATAHPACGRRAS